MNWPALVLDVFFAWTWKNSLHATVLIALVFLIRFFFGKSITPRWRCALGLLVVTRLIIPIVPASHFSIFNLRQLNLSGEIPSTTAAPIFLPAAAVVQPTPIEQKREVLLTAVPRFRLSLADAVKIGWALGVVGLLLMVIRQHRKLFRWVNAQEPISNVSVMDLLEECKAVMGVTKEVKIIAGARLSTPALFGWQKPILLMPKGMLERLEERELRWIFLHELAHLKRHDVLLNWIGILVRSLHWFNPLVWLAMRRLRADAELVCDAMVMAHLNAAERSAYGHTLLKLLDDFSTAGLCPSLVPILNHKNEIKRRIVMIAQFKPSSRLALACSAALLVLLCGFTFTRAAEKKKAVPAPAEAEAQPQPDRQENVRRKSDSSERGLQTLEQEIAKAQAKVDQLRDELGVEDAGDGKESFYSVEPETLRAWDREHIQAMSSHRRGEAMLELLSTLDPNELMNTLPTASPDPLLSELLSKRTQTDQQLTTLLSDLDQNNPEVQRTTRLLEKINQQLKDRVKGIMAGLRTQVLSLEAQAKEIGEQLQKAKAKNLERQLQLRPYLQAKRTLQNQERLRDLLELKITQEKLDAQLDRKR